MKKYILIIAVFIVTGCIPETPEEVAARKKLRIELFERCLEKAPVQPNRTTYNDAAEVIYECDSVARRMSI